MLDEVKQLFSGVEAAQGGNIDDKLGKLQKIAGQLGDNIKKTKNIIDSVSGYDNIISEKDKYCFMFIENIANIAMGLLKLNNKMEVVPVKTVNIVDKTLYGIKSLVMEVVYGCLQNAYEAIEDKRRYLDDSEKSKYFPEIIFSYRDTPRSHIIEIKDNGIGIKPEYFEKDKTINFN